MQTLIFKKRGKIRVHVFRRLCLHKSHGEVIICLTLKRLNVHNYYPFVFTACHSRCEEPGTNSGDGKGQK